MASRFSSMTFPQFSLIFYLFSYSAFFIFSKSSYSPACWRQTVKFLPEPCSSILLEHFGQKMNLYFLSTGVSLHSLSWQHTTGYPGRSLESLWTIASGFKFLTSSSKHLTGILSFSLSYMHSSHQLISHSLQLRCLSPAFLM